METIFELYPIVNGCSTECVFSGTLKDCQAFALREGNVNPEFDYIILPYEY